MEHKKRHLLAGIDTLVGLQVGIPELDLVENGQRWVDDEEIFSQKHVHQIFGGDVKRAIGD